MIPLVVFAAGAGAGCWLVIRALSPRPTRLDALVGQLNRPGLPSTWAPPRREGLGDRAGRIAARLLAGSGPEDSKQRQLLRLTERTPERHALDKMVGSAGGGAAAAMASVGLVVVGFAPPTAVLIVFTIAVVVGGFFLPDALLRDEAEHACVSTQAASSIQGPTRRWPACIALLMIGGRRGDSYQAVGAIRP